MAVGVPSNAFVRDAANYRRAGGLLLTFPKTGNFVASHSRRRWTNHLHFMVHRLMEEINSNWSEPWEHVFAKISERFWEKFYSLFGAVSMTYAFIRYELRETPTVTGLKPLRGQGFGYYLVLLDAIVDLSAPPLGGCRARFSHPSWVISLGCHPIWLR